MILRQKADPEVAVLTGGFDKPYVIGLTAALASQGVRMDVIGSDELNAPEMRETAGLRFLNLHGGCPSGAGMARKVWDVAIFYVRLLRYTAASRPRVFHILWNNKVPILDRTLLMLFYKLWRKKIAFTAHNVNAGQRDSTDSALNRLTLKLQYRLSDRIFVHTQKMKAELLEEFGVPDRAVQVIPFGMNETVPDTPLTPAEARRRLGFAPDERIVLFFGHIGPYKGLEYLLDAMKQVVERGNYRLVIAGKPRGGCTEYMRRIEEAIASETLRPRVTAKIEHIADADTEMYFKAADVLALPYTEISQSGVLFLGYAFGLPVIASRVGSFEEEVVVGRTGFLCRPRDSADLAAAIEKYFASSLFEDLGNRRAEIRETARARHSWEEAGGLTRNVYAELLEE